MNDRFFLSSLTSQPLHLLSFLFIPLLLITCSKESPTQEVGFSTTSFPLPQITAGNYPAMDGSTSTSPVGAMLACKIIGVPCKWMENMDGSRSIFPNLTNFQGEFPAIGHHGTHNAYLNLINKEADLILVARLPSLDEINLANSFGVRLVPEPVALDAFVFIVNEVNPVEQLTKSEIQRIYTGEIINWDQVAGRDEEIHPYQRNENSGSQELMRALVMGDLHMLDVPEMVLPKMIAPFYAVSEETAGIGYSVYYYEQNMAPEERVKLVEVDGIKPNSKSIQSKEYPLTTEVYVVIRGDLSAGSIAFQLRDWLLSPEGQELMKKSGYVPISN